MPDQRSLFVPTAQGEQAAEPLEARLLHRTTDPVTSRNAAVHLVTSGALTAQQRIALRILAAYGPGTTWELADCFLADPYATSTQTRDQVHYLLARRLPEMKEYARVQKVNGKAVVRDNSRVWEMLPCTQA